LNQEALYQEYKWDEPWDGPSNRKLLSRMPEVYRNAAAGEARTGEESTHTHYAIITGEGTGFTSEGSQFDSPFAVLPGKGKRLTFGDIKDPVGESILLGELNAEAKIPWTKPEDLTLPGVMAQLGGKDSFGTNHQTQRGPAAAVAFADTSVRYLLRDTKPEALNSLLAIADGNRVNDTEPSGALRTSLQAHLLLVVEKTGGVPTARIDAELR